MNNRCKPSSISGVSLIEIIIVIVILSILISVGGMLLGAGFKGGFASKDSIYVASIARTAFERMGNEIKEAKSATATDLTALSNTITFNSITGESVTYSLSGTNLMRNSQILSSHVSSLTFTYLDQTNDTTTDATQVRCIVIAATVTFRDNTVNLQTAVCPRNYIL